MILLPYGLLLLSGLFTAEPLMRILLGFADVALIAILIYSFKPYSKTKLIGEIAAYIVLFFPLAFLLINFALDWFDYWLFWLPLTLSGVLFPSSIYQMYKRREIVNPCFIKKP
jgi:hypothetical protein